MTHGGVDHRAIKDQFVERGYVHVPSLGVTPADLAEARGYLDQLFDRFAELPPQFAHDLGRGEDRAHPVLPEIVAVSTLAPALRRTKVFEAALEVARELLGPTAYVLYDHAIYKPPGQAGATSWHQDSGYDTEHTERLAVWIPFQDTGVVDGAMRYVPRSHLGGRQQHLTRTTPDGKTVSYLDVDESAAVDQPCDLGGATAHDFHTVHGAGANLGNDVRRAWILDFGVGSRVDRAIEAAKEKVRIRRFRVI